MTDDRSTVVFMGSPDFAVPTLDALFDAGDFDLVRVVSQPDRPRGRGKRVTPTPVRARALALGLATTEMSKTNYHAVVADLTPLAPDFIVVAAFGLILGSDLLDLPRKGCVNLHPSLLPRYRGVSPIQAAILAGDAETGCTTMLMDEGVDTGDTLLRATVRIDDRDTSGTLHDKLAKLGAPLIVETLRGLSNGTVQRSKQDDNDATYTKMIRKSDGLIDWSEGATEIERRIRAMTPWPSAYTTFDGRRMLILEATKHRQAGAGEPGEIVSLDPLLVATGQGVVELMTVKMEGKKAIAANALRTGYRVTVGDTLG